MTTVGDGLYQWGGVPVGGEFTTGDVFFVDSVSGNDSNSGSKPSTALASADAATNKCTANTNNIVYFMPNHAETIASASTWVPDVAGVQYIGVGMGADAPEFTFSATGSTITVTGGNNTFKNIRFVAGISAVTVGMTVSAVDHITFENCVWDFSTTAFDFARMMRVDGSDYVTIQNCRFIAENITKGCSEAVSIDDAQNLIVDNNIFMGNFGTTVLQQISSDANCKNALITNNMFYNDDTGATRAAIQFAGAGASNAVTGIISRNMIATLTVLDTDVPLIMDPGSCIMFENYISRAIDHYGVNTFIGTASSAA